MIRMLKFLFISLFKIIKVSFYVIFYVVNLLFSLWGRLFGIVINKLRFSITFKITTTYVLLFLLLFSLISVGIVMSFDYHLQNGSPQDYVAVLEKILGIFTFLGLIVIILFGSKASRKQLLPVKTMTGTLKEISIQELDKRLDVGGAKDELKDLAQTCNDMLERIELSVEQQNRFVSDASHELRTPLAVIQGYANLLDRWGKDDKIVLDEAVTAIKGEAENMGELIEKLLFLARGDRKVQSIEAQDFYLNELIEEVLKETKLIDENHFIDSEKNEVVTINADRKLIKEALRIFIDNSLKYTPSGGHICINSYQKKGAAVLSIEDSGIGIAAKDLPHIFDRFYRADESRTKKSGGTGLGLAIAKWIIDNHQGKIMVWSEPQEGTIIRIELPLSHRPSTSQVPVS